MISGHFSSFSSFMPILVLVEKVVRLFCVLSGLIMSLPAWTINKTFLKSYCAVYLAIHLSISGKCPFRNINISMASRNILSRPEQKSSFWLWNVLQNFILIPKTGAVSISV